MKLWMIAFLLLLTFILATCTNTNDQPVDEAGDAVRGAELFQTGNGTDAPPCITCHRVTAESTGLALGPTLEDIATTAATRIDGVEAEAYIQQSILDPEAYEVPGYRVGMYSGYGEHFSEQDIDDLIAYLLSL